MKKLHLVLLVAVMIQLFGLAVSDRKKDRPSRASIDPVSISKKAVSRPEMQGTEVAPENPPVAVIEKTVYDAGLLRPGMPLEHTFVIKNKGTGALRILNARGE